jgi:hypothetical protein
MTNATHHLLRKRFPKVFGAGWDRSELANCEELLENFAIPTAEGATNLQELAKAYESPAKSDTQCLSKRTGWFFLDCGPHLMMAARIDDEIPATLDEQKGVHHGGRRCGRHAPCFATFRITDRREGLSPPICQNPIRTASLRRDRAKNRVSGRKPRERTGGLLGHAP